MAQQPPQWAKASSLARIQDHAQLFTPHSVGLLQASDQPVAETSTWQHTTLTTDRHAYPQRDSNPYPSKRAAAYLRLRPRSHWDRHKILL